MGYLRRSTGIFALLLAMIAHAQSSGSATPQDVKKLLAQAIAAANQARESEAKVQALQTILSLEVRVGNSAEAQRQAAALSKTDDGTRYVVCEVAVAVAARGDTQGAFAILKSEDPEEFGYWCYTDIANAQAEAGDFAGAAESASHQEAGLYRTIILAGAAQHAFAAGKTDAVDKLFELALASARKTDDAADRIESLFMVARELGEAGKLTEIEPLLPEMQAALPSIKDDHKRENAITVVALAEADAGKLSEAFETIQALKDKDREDFARSMLIERLAKTGDLSLAAKNIQMLHNESQRVSSTSGIAIARAKQGDIVGALAMVIDGSDEYDQRRSDWTRAHIAVELGKIGKNREALQTAHLISDDLVRAGALIVLGSGVPLSDSDHEADTIFGEARDAALKIPELYFRATALSHLAGVLSARGKFADARNAADAIPSDAEDWMLGDLEKHKGHALENIAFWQCKMGTCKGDLDWVVREVSPILRSFAIAGVVQAMMGLKPPSDHFGEENYGW